MRSRLMFAMSYDAALRRHELVTLDTTDIDPAHRFQSGSAQNIPRIAVSGWSPTRCRLHSCHLLIFRSDARSAAPGVRCFVGVEPNAGRALSIWSWSKTVVGVARASGVLRFTTHTLRHLCLTDLARAGWDIHVATFAGTSEPRQARSCLTFNGGHLRTERRHANKCEWPDVCLGEDASLDYFSTARCSPRSSWPSSCRLWAGLSAGPCSQPLALIDVTVIDVNRGERLAQRTVVITNGRIEALGPSGTTAVPAGAEVDLGTSW